MASTSAKTAFACFLAAAAWPWSVGALARLVMSPLDQATRSAWCGMPAHTGYEALGHCAVCWVGSALLVTVGILLLPSHGGVRTRSASAARERFQEF